MKIDFIKFNIFPRSSVADKSKNTNKNVWINSAAKDAVMNHLCAVQNYNLPFLGKTTPRPVYAIDKEKNCIRFPSANKASKEFGIASPSVLDCLSGKNRYAGDYCFILASEVEIVKEDGTIELDEEKIDKVYNAMQIARAENANLRRRAIYSIDKDGNLHQYESVAKAAGILNVSHSNISNCINGSKNTVGGHMFFGAEKIEIQNEKGETVIDEEKLQALRELAKAAFSNPYAAEKMSLYAIYKDGTYTRFERITDAIKQLKIAHQTITASLSGKNKFTNGYCFVKSDEIETTKEDGSVEIDEEKIKKLAKEAQIAFDNNTCARGKAVYAVKVDDLTAIRFEKSAWAAKALGLSLANISSCLSGRKLATSGYYFIHAYKIEVENDGEDDVHKIDNEKFLALIKELQAASKNKAKTSTPRKKRTPAKKTSQSVEAKQEKASSVPSVEAPKTEQSEAVKKQPALEKPSEPQVVAKPPVSAKPPVVETPAAKKPQASPPVKPAEIVEPKKEAPAPKPTVVQKTSDKPAKAETSAPKKPLEPAKPVASVEPAKPKKKTSVPKSAPVEKDKPLAMPTSDTKTVPVVEKAKDEDAAKLRRRYKRLGRIYALKKNGDYLEFKDLWKACEHFGVEPDFLYKVLKSIDGKYNNMLFTSDSDG